MSSGNTEASVAAYKNKHGITFPIIVDQNLKFAKAFGMNISLRNVWQEVTLGVNGEKAYTYTKVGAIRHMKDATIGDVVKDATWRIDPTNITATHKKAWRAFEFGQFDKGLKLYLSYKKPRKEGAELDSYNVLDKIIMDFIKNKIEKAESHKEADELYEAVLIYMDVIETYKKQISKDDMKTYKATIKELKKDKEVAKEFKIMKKFDSLFKKLKKTKIKSKKESLKKQVLKFIKKYKDSKAAKAAKEKLG